MRTQISRLVAAALLSVGAALPLQAGSGNPNPGVLPPQSHVHGKTYAEWGATWWEWVLSIPADVNPLLDPTGANAAQGQSGSVWFLAGNFGGTDVRTCTIPTGKSVLFPILNVVFSPVFGDPDDEATLKNLAAGYFTPENTATLVCEIDGVALQHLGAYLTGPSDSFEFSIPPGGLPRNSEVVTSYGVSNGYYIMLAPLSPGQHTIHFAGTAAQHGISLDVTYHLTVTTGR